MSRIAIDYQGQHLPMPLSETVEGEEIVFRGLLTCKTNEDKDRKVSRKPGVSKQLM
ncbi:MAG: hypothetical protein ACQ9ET_05565 [Nitrosomonadaceae bacterium]